MNYSNTAQRMTFERIEPPVRGVLQVSLGEVSWMEGKSFSESNPMPKRIGQFKVECLWLVGYPESKHNNLGRRRKINRMRLKYALAKRDRFYNELVLAT